MRLGEVLHDPGEGLSALATETMSLSGGKKLLGERRAGQGGLRLLSQLHHQA